MSHGPDNEELTEEEAVELSLDPNEIGLLRCIENISSVIGLETRQLKSGARVDFEGYNHRKAYLLFEFSRLIRSIPKQTSPLIQGRLEQLRAILSENERLLSQHMRALEEVSEIIVTIMSTEASDGTYSAPIAGKKSHVG